MRRVVAVAAALLLCGCASMSRGWDDQVGFGSTPPGATVRTSFGLSCMTPCMMPVSRKQEFSVSYSMPGYITEDVVVRTRLSGNGAAEFAGNIVIGGVVGMGIDAASGATLDHCPNPVGVRMRRIGSKEPPDTNAARCSD